MEGYATSSKKRKTCQFWKDFFHDYWREFPWRLELTEEPDLDVDVDAAPDTAEAVFQTLDLDLSQEELSQKAEKQRKVKQKIKRWYNRQRPNAMGIAGNPFFDHLVGMRRKKDDDSPPKPLADYQYYLHHPEFKDRICYIHAH
ncbi:hypothetical protein C8R43DRAFT_1124272 [Mycena crocata]|nr:hypothetical protein C8R43DRAFT_1124272 [Mycena crocata]